MFPFLLFMLALAHSRLTMELARLREASSSSTVPMVKKDKMELVDTNEDAHVTDTKVSIQGESQNTG